MLRTFAEKTAADLPSAKTGERTAESSAAQEEEFERAGGAFPVGIVIPVFRHSHLMVEAVESALAQDYRPKPTIVIVNDGCPHPETHFIAKAYADAHPDRIRYVFKKNGGLSSARNAGIDYLLKEQPEIGAIYLLDADNRLEPYAITRFATALNETGADWAYPDIVQFGIAGGYDLGGTYSVLTHLERNVCEAGSLVDARVLRSGVRYDERMTKGYEDWEFWLQAVDKGFRGVHVPNSGFQYRKRPSSMLSESHTEDADIKRYIREKHKALFKPKNIRSLCAAERPSLAIVDLFNDEVLIGEDPLCPSKRISLAELGETIWRGIDAPERYGVPLTIVFTRRNTADPLLRRMLRGIVWSLHKNLHGNPFHALSLSRSTDGHSMSLAEKDLVAPDAVAEHCDFLAVSTHTYAAVLQDTRLDWLVEQWTSQSPTLSHQWLAVADIATAQTGKNLFISALSAATGHRNAEYARSVGASWLPRARGIDLLHGDRHAGTLEVGTFGFPISAGNRPSIAFILPLIDFGGVEKVALNVAREFNRVGWNVSVLVLGCTSTRLPLEEMTFVDDLAFIDDFGLGKWSDEQKYFGEAIPRNNAQSELRLVRTLQYFDCVVNCHSWALTLTMARLKKQGTVTCTYLHLVDESIYGRHCGHINVAMAFEHAYSYLITCSHTLAREIEALGVPASKVVAVPNAPGYRIEDLEPELQVPAKPRRFPPGHRPRLLFLGRLDRQKGLHRLAALHAATRHFCDWRIVGRAIVSDNAPDLGFEVEPPVYDVNELERLYRWADFYVLLSDFEGLPLGILEAMRAGAIPIATDVGANREVISHAERGFLVDMDDAVNQALQVLRTAVENNDIYEEMSRRIIQETGRIWERQALPLIERLTEQPRDSALSNETTGFGFSSSQGA